MLHGIDLPSLRAFHEIHDRDRASFLEAVLPLTLQRVGPAWSDAYFSATPFADDDVRVECARYVHHLVDAGADEGTLSLARYELAKLLLLDEPPFSPAGRMAWRDPASLALAPGLAVVPAGAHLPTLVEEPLHDAGLCAGVALLRRDPEDVTCAWLEGPTAGVLTIVASGEREHLARLVDDEEARRAFLQLISEGVLA